MSNYDPVSKIEMSSGKRPEDSQPSPRETLPSLSSLFGPVSHIRPLYSPLSDRPGTYASASPLDRPYGVNTAHDRPYASSSYFPLTGSLALSQPRSVHDPGFEERAAVPPTSRPSGEVSPSRPREGDHDRGPGSSSALGSGSSAGRWPVYQESGSSEYTLGSRDGHFYRPAEERHLRVLGQKHEDDGSMTYGEQRGPSGGGGGNPPGSTTPTSTVTSEGIPAKDGLGPKIWTGTHFLPRFVKAAEVPGEGMCYFYDDGTHCKTVIDGEAVNALWGVTKAGKPRKRLAIACVTCREKKIKCDPDYPRCVQCEKFGRVCKFKNAPRGGHNTSPSTPPAETDEHRRIASATSRHIAEQQRPSSNSSESVSPRTILRPPSPSRSYPPPKRLRLGYERFPPTAGQPTSVPSTPDVAVSRPSWQQSELPRISEDVLCRAWQTDPYVSDPQSVISTIASYFVHADAAALRFLPQREFQSWVQSAHRKSPEDLMLIYSILAFGNTLSGGPKSIAYEYSQVARYAADHSSLSLQLVQTRVVLALLYLSVARHLDANDMMSGAVSAALCLRLNHEMDNAAPDVGLTTFPFNMSRTGYMDCRRRTFWACFILERVNGMFPLRLTAIHPEDVFIRLPGDVRSFEEQTEVATPIFEPHLSVSQYPQTGSGIMAYLIQAVTIWGDVMSNAYRMSYRDRTFDYFKFHHHSSVSRLEDWRASLPPQFQFSATTLDLTVREDKGTLILMHLVYHLASVKLHRHAHPRILTNELRQQYSSVAREHASALLNIACVVVKDGGLGRYSMPPPFCGQAIVEAVDVLSAEGALADLPSLVDGLAQARSLLEVLSAAWEDARQLTTVLDYRLDMLAALRDRSATDMADVTAAQISIPGVRVFAHKEERDRSGPKSLSWQIPNAIETRFPREMDCVYASITPLLAPAA
ncbi:hypothetical protein VTK73DRAFT_222 [Phialemonium thermophilum]|uniref:Zn(2)-C6 fungal-type domain-containing protein n=1 Tax=Phialemonium thermophilum TaxID=223376 RepID=A0ABR3XG44_9PEZI